MSNAQPNLHPVHLSIDLPTLHRAAAVLFASLGVVEAQGAALAGRPAAFVVAQAKLQPVAADIIRIARACIESAHNLQQAEHMVVSAVETTLAIFVPQINLVLDAVNTLGAAASKVRETYSNDHLRITKRQELTGQATQTLSTMLERLAMACGAGEILVEATPAGSVSQGGTSSRHFTLYLPGTQSWSPVPGRSAFDFTSNVEGMLGIESASQLAAEKSLRAAGFGTGSNDTVTIVGYSQGALIGKNLIHGGLASHVTGFVSIAAPIDGANLPSHVKVINMQHSNDPVPKLDFQAPVERTNWINVNLGRAGIIGHNLDTYLQSVEDLGANQLSKINHMVASISASGDVDLVGFGARRN